MYVARTRTQLIPYSAADSMNIVEMAVYWCPYDEPKLRRARHLWYHMHPAIRSVRRMLRVKETTKKAVV